MGRLLLVDSRAMIDTLLVDWSGTLADDLGATLTATNAVFAAYGELPLDRPTFQREFELPFMRFYGRFLPGRSREEVDACFFTAYEPLRHQVPLLPAARALLAFARDAGVRVHLFSTMRADLLEAEVARLDLAPLVDGIHGSIGDKRRAMGPLLAKLDARPDATLFVGDMVHDVEAARQAGVRAVAVATGYTGRAALAEAHPDYLFDDLGEVVALLARDGGVEQLAMPIATVGGLVVHDDGEILLVRTAKWSGKWGTPGGKIDYGETMEQAFLREVEEETGLVLTNPEIVLVQDAVFSPEFHTKKHFLLVNLRGSAHTKAVRLNYEAQDYAWVTPAAAVGMELNEPTRVLIHAVLGGDANRAERWLVMADKIQIHDLAVDCIIGIHPWERQHAQRLFVDVEMAFDLAPAARDDDFTQTVDYDACSQGIERIAVEGQFQLIETLAEQVAAWLLATTPITAATVRVRKPQALNKAVWAGVEIHRQRGGGAG